MPLKTFTCFTIYGPLIAALLIVLYGHLFAVLTLANFGHSFHPLQIMGMILMMIPVIICAYIIGFMPAWITGSIFSALVENKMLESMPSKIRFIGLGMLAGSIWLIVTLIIALIAHMKVILCLVAVSAVIIPTSIACSYLESRASQVKNKNSIQNTLT